MNVHRKSEIHNFFFNPSELSTLFLSCLILDTYAIYPKCVLDGTCGAQGNKNTLEGQHVLVSEIMT